MPASAHAADTRINLRTSPETKALIERAASLTLSQRAFDEFVTACEKPAKPTKALRDLMGRR